MLVRLPAIIVALTVLLSGCTEDSGPRDASYRSGPVSGEWHELAVGDTELGRTAAVEFANSASRLKRTSDSSELVTGGHALMMFDEAFPPYMLLRLRADDMAEAIHANYQIGLGRPLEALGSAPFQRGTASFGTLHYAPFQHVGRPCVAFVHQWPRRGPRHDRMQKRLIGTVCDSDVDNGNLDIVTYVTTSLVPRIVNELK